MLDFLVSWAEQLIITLMIVVIIEMILPSESSYRKYIKVVLGVFLIYTIISPILTNKLSTFELGSILATEKNVPNAITVVDNDKQVEDTYKIKLKDNLTEFLKEKGFELIKYNVDLKYKDEMLEIKNINLEIKKIDNNKKIVVDKVTITKNSKIDVTEIERLKSEIGNYYDIDIEKISISESESVNG